MTLRSRLAPCLSALLVVLLATALLPSPAAAQEPDEEEDFGPRAGDWEITLTGSGSNDNNFDSGGFGATGSLGYFFTDRAEVFVRQTVSFADAEDEDSTTLGSTRVGLDYHIPIGRVYPFVGVNIGGVYGAEVDETFAAAPEVGAKFYALEKTLLFAQTEYQFLFEDASGADEGFDDGIFVYSVGIGFNW